MIVKIRKYVQKKRTKNSVIKRKLRFQNYKNCLVATQIENKVNYIEENKTE